MFEKSIFFYIFQKKKPSYVVYGGKAVILVKCPVKKKSPVRSKNWWDGRGEAMQPFRSV